MNIRTLEAPALKRFMADAKGIASEAAAQGVITKEQAASERRFISSMSVGQRFHCTYFTIEDHDGFNPALVVSYAGKRPVGDWGRYLNVYYLYTVVGYRGRGFCGELLRHVEEIYLRDRVARLKGSASSAGGLRTFLQLGHRIWGTADDGTMKVDGLLAPWKVTSRPTEPEGIPPNAQEVCSERPPSRASLIAQMTDPRGRFRLTPEEAEAALCKIV